MHLVIFEGNLWPQFAPFSFTRPVFDLRCGIATLLEQQIRTLAPSRLTLWVRPALAGFCRSEVLPRLTIPADINAPLGDEHVLLSSARMVHLESYRRPHQEFVELDDHGRVRKAWVRAPGLTNQDCLTRSPAWLKLLNLPPVPPQGILAHYAWDLSHLNAQAIAADAQSLPLAAAHPIGAYHMTGDRQVHVAPSATIAPGAVLDASQGPVVVADGASIGANSVLEGPCFIGRSAIIVPLTLIRPGTTIGPNCKVGGEVKQSVMLADSNKAHYGYLGDSYVGQWVNLGAGTTTSNLKNTYGHVSPQLGSRQIPTERQFIGSLIGDHSKLAIGTRLMSGSYVGYCTMWAASPIAPRLLPSLTFWTDKGRQDYQLEKARQVMAAVFARRNLQWQTLDEEILDYARDVARDIEGA